MIETSATLDFHQPWWLLLALLPWLLSTRHYSQRSARMETFAELPLWKWLLNRQPDRRRRMAWPMLFAWLFAVAALGGPYLDRPQTNLSEQRGLDLAVVVDISPSMMVTDISPNRLERAKLELQDFIARLKGDRTALIVFSANAYKVLPLTSDYTTLNYFLESLDSRLTFKRGSNLVHALELAKDVLGASQQQGRGIVLLSDGETDDEASALAAAKRMGKAGLPLFILGIGSDSGGPVRDKIGQFIHQDGQLVISRLQRETLQDMATVSGGLYSDLRNDDNDWLTLFNGLDQLARINHFQVATSNNAAELYPWLLAFSVLLFLWSGIGHNRGAIALIFLITPLLTGHPSAQAAPWNEQQAYQALIDGNYLQAIALYQRLETYNGRMGLGAAYFRQQAWQQAAAAYNEASRLADNKQQRAMAHYNHGNALARLGQLDQAVSAFESALDLQPNFSRAALNLSLINQQRMKIAGNRMSNNPEHNNESTPSREDPQATRQNPTIQGRDDTQDTARSTNNQDVTSQHNAHHRTLTPQELQKAVRQWGLGETGHDEHWNAAWWQLKTLDEKAGRLLRSRLAEQDATYPQRDEAKPW